LNIFDLAEQNFLITFSVVLGIGLLQGAILGRGIRNRFPSLKRHAQIVSSSLLALFSINAILSVLKFADPIKFSISEFTIPATTDEAFLLVLNLIGVNTGVGTVIATFISVTLIIFLRFADIHNIARYFIFILSSIVLIASLLGKFTDFVPTTFQIMLYVFYQLGITLGIFFITRRKESDVLSGIK
jgi:membrane-associated HD superfamily phosphohydrolase